MPTLTPNTEKICTYACTLGFDSCGITPVRTSPHAEYVGQWIANNYHGSMGWLARTKEKRVNITNILPDAQSVISCVVNYFQHDLPDAVKNDPSRGLIARYAWFPDYHDTILHLLNQLIEEIQRTLPHDVRATAVFKPYVDTGPVLEREIAEHAGLGFVGKNTLLINPRFGSYFFIGEIITNIQLQRHTRLQNIRLGNKKYWVTDMGDPQLARNPPQADEHMMGVMSGRTHSKKFPNPKLQQNTKPGCYSCTRCMKACPTGAIESPRTLNANKCISYLTIENKGPIPEHFRPLIGNRIYGCDICQEVCPWNRTYAHQTNTVFTPNPDWVAPKLTDLMALDEQGFKTRFAQSPILRIKRRGFLRNVAVALGNWGSPEALPVLRKALTDHEPLIRDHAAWAIKQIHSEPSM